MSQMESIGLQRVYFDAEDRPPPSYWTKETLSKANRQHSDSTQSAGDTPSSTTVPKISKIDPQEWLKAPEFVPRSRQTLADSFRSDGVPFDTNSGASYVPDGLVMPTSGFTNITEPSATFSSLPTIIDMPQPVFPPHGTIGFPLPQPTRYPLPRSVGLVRFPMPRIAPAPFLIRPPLGLVPPGYSANITQINAGIGPPIPALVLKKKRRKRHRRLKEFTYNQPEQKASPSSAHPADPNGYLSEGDDGSTRESTQLRLQLASSEPDLTKSATYKQASEEAGHVEESLLRGSCPDLSDSQLQLWDNLLYNAVVDEQQRLDNEASSSLRNRCTSRSDGRTQVEYEIASRAVLSAMDSALHVDGICSKEIRRLDKQLQGKGMEDSLCEEQLVDRLRGNDENRFVDSPASTTKSLKAEIEELSFRPTISQYGYPQNNPMRVHMATFNPEYNTTSSSIIDRKAEGYVEDCFEGMHIRVNAFDEGDELALSDSELPQPSRFQQIQWALQRGKQQYARLVPPERVCCTLM
ncbi:hypothetical protein Tcan_16922 [Toxocara canis]|uniref:Uncharacterized protein n=1 Tax=Toxocara canis TaxID=6265 RepID=A0A0B2VSY1_TOXCA|nr:hypothetical protein Tcan_16922 [Toxocara canis]